jgi:LDH2 family malate/lactate/ureidoglycolate dehydrogenase
MDTTTLTVSMEKALAWARAHGVIFAGTNIRNGCQVTFAASVIRALARRGLVTLAISPDGGMMARPVAA